jgi:membrane protease YdiL (CAAX protease family)
MKKIYEKNELHFSLIWIVLYVVLLSAAESISQILGTEKLISAPLCIVIALVLFYWIKKNGEAEKYGLCKFAGNARRFLYFLPLVIVSSANLWGGFTLNFSWSETVLYIISMLCVGFIEEVIFRGFLFKALCKKNVKTAFVISSITFGIGHIVNLLSGADLFSTLLQIVYASAIGFMYTAVYYKGKSLIPCIISHAVVNTTSVFAVQPESTTAIIYTAALTVVSVGYALVLLKPKAADTAIQ